MALGTEIALIKALGGGGSSLPSVTSADAGKVLSVDNSGVWGAQNRVVTLHAEVTADGYIGTDDGNPTFSEIASYAANGYNFACVFSFNSKTFVAALYVAQASAYQIEFVGEAIDYDTNIRYSIKMSASTEDEALVYKGAFVPTDPFIVTLTPTALDYSGTMDKTVAEIDAAYKAGRKIWFMFMNESASFFAPVNLVSTNPTQNYPKFDASILMTAINAFINITTNYAGGDSNLYYTTIYTLTPAT